jgi:hypothetical protein
VLGRGEASNTHRILMGKPVGKCGRWKDNIKMNPRDIGRWNWPRVMTKDRLQY